MNPSIFTQIIDGDIPCYKIYEDEKTIAFLDINPIQPGHTLVVPKAQVDHLEDLGEEDYAALMKTMKLLMLHIRDELQVERVCVKVFGFDVPHAHIHLVPCDTSEDFAAEPVAVEEDELVEMCERLAY